MLPRVSVMVGNPSECQPITFSHLSILGAGFLHLENTGFPVPANWASIVCVVTLAVGATCMSKAYMCKGHLPFTVSEPQQH